MSRLLRLDGPVVPLLLIAAFVASAAIAGDRKRFWMDEIISIEAISAPTVDRCVAFVADKADGNPPLYHLIAWTFARAFGVDEVTLRALSGLFVGLACVVMRGALKRDFGPRAATLGTAVTLALTPLVITENPEARPYALYLFLGACGASLFARIARGGGVGTFLLYALVQAALVFTHTFGFLYGGAALASAVMCGAFGARRFVGLGVATLVGWSSFLLWKDALVADFDTGKPWSWIPVPSAFDLLVSVSHSVAAGHVCVLLAIAAAFARGDRDANDAETAAGVDAAPRPEIRLGARFWTVFAATTIVLPPIAAFVASRTLTSVFLERYMIPSVLGFAALFATFFAGAAPESRGRRGFFETAASLGVFLAALSVPIVEALHRPYETRSVIKAGALARPELPIVYESPHGFLPAAYYGPNGGRCVYVLDWEAAIAPGNAKNASVDYKIMEAFKRRSPKYNVMTTEEILAAYPKFFVSDLSARMWSELRVEFNPAYRVEKVEDNLLLVERVSDPPVNAPDSR